MLFAFSQGCKCKGCFPLGGIFRAQRRAEGRTNRKKTKKNCAARGKFRPMENSLKSLVLEFFFHDDCDLLRIEEKMGLFK